MPEHEARRSRGAVPFRSSLKRLGSHLLLIIGLPLLAAPGENRLRLGANNSLEITAAPGLAYQLQQSRSLTPDPLWENAGTPLTVTTAGPLSWVFSPTNAQNFFRIEIRNGAGGLSRAEAEGRVLATIIRPAEQTNLVLGLRWPETLPAGAVIQPLSTPEEDPQAWVVDAPAHLLVIDHAPSQKLAHPFTYALVDIATGTIRTIPSFYPPVVDGVSRLTSLADRWKSEARFFPTNFTGSLPPLASSISFEIPELDPTNSATFDFPLFAQADAGTNNTSTARSTVNCTNVVGKKIAVVIASGADYEIQNDARDMGALLTRLGFQVTEFNSSSNTVTQVFNGIKQAGQALGPCDKFFVYLSSHTQLVDDNDDGRPDQTPIRLDYGLGHSNATKWAWLPGRASTFTSALQAVPAGQLNLMMDTCFAESFAVLMRQHKGYVPVGATWNIFASSSRTNTSGGASELDLWLDYNNDDVNSVYTGNLLEKVTAAADADQIDTNRDGQLSIDEIEKSFLDAHTAVQNELAGGQQPKFDQLLGSSLIAVGDTFVVAPAQASTNKTALGDTIVPGTQFVLVDAPALHADLFSWNPATGEMTLTPLTTVSEVTFRYKLVVGMFETDPVTVTLRLDPRMNYAEEFLTSGPDTVRVPCILLDNLLYPIYQFRLTNNPADTCKEPHWHAHGTVFPLDVLGGPGRTDPNPSACGFGTVKQVTAAFLEVSKDLWQQFLIDHIPPIP